MKLILEPKEVPFEFYTLKTQFHAISKKKQNFTTIFKGFEVPVVYISEFERSRVNLLSYIEKKLGP